MIDNRQVEVANESNIGSSASEWRQFTAINAIVAGLLLIALADLPYGYYTLLRFAVTFVVTASAVRRFAVGRWSYGSLLILIAVVFNPFFPLHLGREIWAFVDVLAAVILLASEFVPPPGMTVRQYLALGERDLQRRGYRSKSPDLDPDQKISRPVEGPDEMKASK